jgi:hypothetical protein
MEDFQFKTHSAASIRFFLVRVSGRAGTGFKNSAV